ncbi:MAG: hypothetical protein KC910_22660, partial [Candidatus Eremiobacteraeota bacterium]|nr:hypothetical protein [Candidatus Eremiobacteraeota bacterium]
VPAWEGFSLRVWLTVVRSLAGAALLVFGVDARGLLAGLFLLEGEGRDDELALGVDLGAELTDELATLSLLTQCYQVQNIG